jgi:hypothetical protein
MTEMDNWMPLFILDESSSISFDASIEQLGGRLISDTSLFGSLLKMSAFAEDDPKIVEKYFMDISNEMQTKSSQFVSQRLLPILGSYRVTWLNFDLDKTTIKLK